MLQLLTRVKNHCIFAVLVLFVFHNWAHPSDRPVLGGFFLNPFYSTAYLVPSSLITELLNTDLASSSKPSREV